MDAKAAVVKCCVCGREKTADGWRYAFRPGAPQPVTTPGFCDTCYEQEIRKARLRLEAAAPAALLWAGA